jgi:hypothetical protein
MFNAIKYTQEMEQAGFSRAQADVSLKILIEVMNENFATKSDLFETEARLKAEIKAVETSVRELDYKLTIKLGLMLTAAVGITATLFKLLQGFHS